MGSIIASFCGACFAGMCCGACAQCKPAKTGPSSRIPYLFILILSGIFATFMSVYGETHWDLKVTSVNCKGCAGNGSVFRTSFCLFFFELIHVIFIGLGAVSFHWLFFAMKFLVYVGAIIFTFFFGSNAFYSNYGEFSRYGPSPIYLLLQILVLINFGYELNDSFIKKGNSGKKLYFWLLVGGSIVFYILAFVLLGLFFMWYGGTTCNTHNTLITISIVLVILNAGFSAWIGKGNFFVSAIVSLYVTYLTFAGLQASTYEKCNDFSSDKDSILYLWIGVSFALLTLCYAGLKSNLVAQFFQEPKEDLGMEEPLLNDQKKKTVNKSNKDIEEGNDNETNEGDNDENNDKSNYDEDNAQINKSNYNDPELESNAGDEDTRVPLTVKKEAVSFHIIMTLAAAYMAMLLTNWGTAKGNIATTGTASVWVNIVCAWVTSALFYWTLLAPKLCPGRFDQQTIDE